VRTIIRTGSEPAVSDGHLLTEPPSLREFLAAGCDLADVPGLKLPLLVDLIATLCS
jgi:hypothetical protein